MQSSLISAPRPIQIRPGASTQLPVAGVRPHAFGRGPSGLGERTRSGRALEQMNEVVAPLQRMMSGLTGTRGPIPTFQCSICFENYPLDQRVIFEKCGNVEHCFCRQCMQADVTFKITENRLQDIVCPGCTGSQRPVATDTEIRRWITDPDVIRRYHRFKRVKDDPTLRDCPNTECDALVEPKKDQRGEVVPEMTCDKCGQKFCYHHSLAHQASSCEEYQREEIRLKRRKSQQDGFEGTLPCPHCGITTEKIAGCNHMACAVCRGNWCWACGDAITNTNAVSAHFSAANPKGCRQFDNMPNFDEMFGGGAEQLEFLHRQDTSCPWILLRILTFPVKLFFLAVFAVCTLLFLIVASIFGLICGCCLQMHRRVWTTFAGLVALIPYAVCAVVWTCIAMFFAFCCICVGADRDKTMYVVLIWVDVILDIYEGTCCPCCCRARRYDQLGSEEETETEASE